MPTYSEIQRYVKDKHGFQPKRCWIAHMKELCSLPVKQANNRYDPNSRTNPCPVEKQAAMMEAFRHFGMIR